MDTISNLMSRIGVGVLTLAFLGGIGYLMYLALFNVPA
jgi:hypothetical protein